SLVLADTVGGMSDAFQPTAREQLRFIETHSMAEVAKARITRAFTDDVSPLMRGHLIETVSLNDKDTYERSARAAFGFTPRGRLGGIAGAAAARRGRRER